MVATPKTRNGMTEEGSSGKVSDVGAADSEDETRSQTVKAGILLGGILLFRMSQYRYSDLLSVVRL
jgi:hypothetical protein